MKHIDLTLPDNATKIVVTFQLPDNDTTIDNVVKGTLNEKPIKPVSVKYYSTARKIADAIEAFPNATISEIMNKTGYSIHTVDSVIKVLERGTQELNQIMLNGEVNAIDCRSFMVDFTDPRQREFIKVHGVRGIKDYIIAKRKRGSKRPKTQTNVFNLNQY